MKRLDQSPNESLAVGDLIELIKGKAISSIRQVIMDGEFVSEITVEGSKFYLDEEEHSMLISALIDQDLVIDKIPENSKTLLIKEGTSRFNSALWFDKILKQNITVAGLGGIGSYVVFMLSRMDVRSLTLYDPDKVETVNLSGQLYSKSQIGLYKADAIADMIENYSDYHSVSALTKKLDTSSAITGITICGFDNMKARKDAFKNWTDRVLELPKERREECLFIDGRLTAEEFQVFCIKGDDMDNIRRYEPYLFSDFEADPTVCSYKQTTFMANMIGSVIVNLFVNFIANKCNPLIDRDLPFYTEYNAETMYFKTIS